MTSKTTQLIINVLLILGTIIGTSILVSYLITSNTSESFSNLSPGGYPCTQATLPLEGWYKTKENPGFSDLSVDEQYEKYPVFPARSEESNNKRHWEQPDNGRCSPPGLCGNVYEKKEIPKISGPKPVPFGSGRRVNFFNSESDV